MSKVIFIILAIGIVLIGATSFLNKSTPEAVIEISEPVLTSTSTVSSTSSNQIDGEVLEPQPNPEMKPEKVLNEAFDGKSVLYEAPSIEASLSPNWWVNSGAYLKFNNGVGETVQGNLPKNSPYVEKYAEYKSERTALGFRPQNIFRLLTVEKFFSPSETLTFKVNETDVTDSAERTQSNGVLLFGHYLDQNNLYYAGVRVDGNLVIKKKKNGVYYTLAQKKLFTGEYDKFRNSNLIPKEEWLTMQASFNKISQNAVMVTLSIDTDQDGVSDERLVAVDDGFSAGGTAFVTAGHAGIRTDFMDVSFANFEVTGN